MPQREKSGGGQDTNICILEPVLRSFALCLSETWRKDSAPGAKEAAPFPLRPLAARFVELRPSSCHPELKTALRKLHFGLIRGDRGIGAGLTALGFCFLSLCFSEVFSEVSAPKLPHHALGFCHLPGPVTRGGHVHSFSAWPSDLL